jgi:hypothetical protein
LVQSLSGAADALKDPSLHPDGVSELVTAVVSRVRILLHDDLCTEESRILSAAICRFLRTVCLFFPTPVVSALVSLSRTPVHAANAFRAVAIVATDQTLTRHLLATPTLIQSLLAAARSQADTLALSAAVLAALTALAPDPCAARAFTAETSGLTPACPPIASASPEELDALISALVAGCRLDDPASTPRAVLCCLSPEFLASTLARAAQAAAIEVAEPISEAHQRSPLPPAARAQIEAAAQRRAQSGALLPSEARFAEAQHLRARSRWMYIASADPDALQVFQTECFEELRRAHQLKYACPVTYRHSGLKAAVSRVRFQQGPRTRTFRRDWRRRNFGKRFQPVIRGLKVTGLVLFWILFLPAALALSVVVLVVVLLSVIARVF